MAGKQEKFAAVRFFWTTQFDVTLNYVRHARSWDEIIVHGDVANHDFLAFNVKGFRILALTDMNRGRELAIFEELVRLDRIPAPDAIENGSIDLLAHLHFEGSSAHAIL